MDFLEVCQRVEKVSIECQSGTMEFKRLLYGDTRSPSINKRLRNSSSAITCHARAVVNVAFQHICYKYPPDAKAIWNYSDT